MIRRTGHWLGLGAAVCAIAWTMPAAAGETILYERAPEWVELADIESAIENAETPVLVLDRQIRVEDGRLWKYVDTAFKVSTPQELTQAGTIFASWQPDKGDLVIHEVSILRGEEAIDVIAAGNELEVLRREQSLERRILDGQLTATMAVPGLQVGDVLRLRYSVSLSEQALGDEVQQQEMLFRKPGFRAGFARLQASWDEAAPVHIRTGPEIAEPVPEKRDGYYWVSVPQPLEKADEVPNDAPIRYRRPATFQLSTFSDWAGVSSVMAPLYETEGTIEADPALAATVERIRKASPDKLSQAVAALEVVQEEIGYLANGMNGGNYLPQSPAETWEKRYGDCKAKTLLLLAILRDLDIEAEGFMVSTELGDAVPTLLPMPGAFNHILVRATIDGQEYFLDGTSAGANRRLIGNVPPFEYGLPIRNAGADIMPIRQTLPRVPETDIAITVDQRAGLDIPALVEAEVDIWGLGAAMITSQAANLTDEQKYQMASNIIYPIVGDAQVVDVSIKQGEDDSEAKLAISALATSLVRWEGKQGKMTLPLPIADFGFNPDRARRSWRDIPVDIGAPKTATIDFTVLVPDEAGEYSLEGSREIDTKIAAHRIERKTQLDGGRLHVVESITGTGGEIASEDVAAARRSAAGLTGKELVLVAPSDAVRRSRFAGMKDRSALARVEAAYSAQIASDPDDVTNYENRAQFRMMTYDFDGALADMNEAIELESSATRYAIRSQILSELRNREGARKDLEEAFDLDPSPYRAMALADAMADTGDLPGATDLLLQQGGDVDVEDTLAVSRAFFAARSGDIEAGLALIDELLARKPNDANMLNHKCWYMGVWQVQLDDALAICTRALENSSSPAPVLDSRAMVYLRLGRLDEAMADARAALELAPDLVNTELLRGLILREQGDSSAKKVIDAALARSPAIGPVYERYGFTL